MNTQPAALHSPAAERNRQPILDALLRLLPAPPDRPGMALEIASGSGQHVAHFAAAMPAWQWLATDPDPRALASIAAHWPTGPAPLRLDVCQNDWHLPPSHRQLDAIYCANMLHISPWATCPALLRGAAAALTPGGRLIIYGPFIIEGRPTAPSNLAFDADLRRRDPAWGLRSLDEVKMQGAQAGLFLNECIEMPANNMLLAFGRSTPKG
jgi:SAM-dependent methyltransferase